MQVGKGFELLKELIKEAEYRAKSEGESGFP
jgi:hypothetical protein